MNFKGLIQLLGIVLLVFSNLTLANDLPAHAKASYIFNISKLVSWTPTEALHTASNFNICVLGNDIKLAQELKNKNTTIHNKNVSIKHYFDDAELGNCHVVFISQSEQGVLKSILKKLEHTAILTISDIPNFIQNRGMFELVIQNKKIVFGVNPACIKSSGLNANPNLLTLAHNKIDLNHGGTCD